MPKNKMLDWFAIAIVIVLIGLFLGFINHIGQWLLFGQMVAVFSIVYFGSWAIYRISEMLDRKG